MSLYLEPEVYEELRELAHRKRTKMHPLILSAIDMLFRAEGSPSIDELLRTRKRIAGKQIRNR